MLTSIVVILHTQRCIYESSILIFDNGQVRLSKKSSRLLNRTLCWNVLINSQLPQRGNRFVLIWRLDDRRTKMCDWRYLLSLCRECRLNWINGLGAGKKDSPGWEVADWRHLNRIGFNLNAMRTNQRYDFNLVNRFFVIPNFIKYVF